MLSRRTFSKLTTGVIVSQKRYDGDRWYGHTLELDIHNYRYTGEMPGWTKKRERTEEETNFAKSVLPHCDFASTWEALLFDADRLNARLNRKEFGNEIKARLEKQSNTVARSQQLVKDGLYANEPRTEDIMISRIFDEEHIQAELKYAKCIRANELSEDNRLDILPGGSPNSLREKTRWCVNIELHPSDRAEIATRLTAWLPEKYHILYFDDFQTVAANDPSARKEMLAIAANLKAEYAAEAKASGYDKDLDEVVAEIQDDVDPTRLITSEAIKSCTSLDTLEQWSQSLHEYSNDDRIVEVYERATQLTKNKDHQELLANLKVWRALANKQAKQ